MALVASQYVIIAAAALAAVLLAGAYMAGYLPLAFWAPKVHVSANVTKVVYYPGAGVLYVDSYVASASNVEVCIDGVVIVDLNTGYEAVVGSQQSVTDNLPVCLGPDSAFHLALSYLTGGAAPLNAGDEVEVKFYYSLGGPSAFDPSSPRYAVSYATLAVSAPSP